MQRTWLFLIFSSAAFGCLGSADPNSGNETCLDSDKIAYYLDSDGDGYGDAQSLELACSAPTGYVLDSTDCDDTEPLAYSSNTEMCGDKVDNDCQGGDACVSSLTAHWAFNDVTGEQVSDESGSGHIGLLQGGLTHSADSMLVFDGIDDYVEVADALAFQLEQGTISFWFMPTAIGQLQSMVSKDSSGNDAGGHLSFYLDADGTVRVRLQSNQADFEISTPSPVTAAEWHHVAFGFGGTEGMSLYVDGELAGKNPYTGGMVRNLEPLVIGAGTDQSGDLTAQPISSPFAGQISDVQMYDRKLLVDEITTLRAVSMPLQSRLF